MKKLLYIPFIILVFWACNPMEETYKKLDEIEKPYSEKIEYELNKDDYQLVSKILKSQATNSEDSSYASDISKYQAFNSRYTAADYMNLVLYVNYPALNLGSEAIVSYKTQAKPEQLSMYESAEKYTISADDYIFLGGEVADYGFFTPSNSATNLVPSILESVITEPKDSTYIVVTCQESEKNTNEITPQTISVYSEDFNEGEAGEDISHGGWTQYAEKGSKKWIAKEYSGNKYAQFSSYSSGEENVCYLISPKINLSASSNNTLTFDINVGKYKHDGLEIFISENFNGSYESATWNNITSSFTIPQEPTDGYGEFTNAGVYDLNSHGNSNISIAFKYTGNGNNNQTTTYQIDNVTVSGKGYDNYTANYLFRYNSSEWTYEENVIVLNPLDYKAMGAPGKYNSFSTSVNPQDYIPAYLKSISTTVPQISSYVVMYDYYDGKTTLKADKYDYKNDVWSSLSYGSVMQYTDQFIHNGEAWNFDPSITYTMVKEDFMLIVTYAKETFPEESSPYDDSENYYGASAHYTNFDIREGKWNGEAFESFHDANTTAIKIVLLPKKFPNAVINYKGIKVYYNIQYQTYSGERAIYNAKFECTKEGPNPEFKLVETPTVVVD